MKYFNLTDLLYVVTSPVKVLSKFNALVARVNGVAEIFGNRTFATDTDDTECKVTGVASVVGDATAKAGNTSTGTGTSSGYFTGAKDASYEFKVTAPCTVAGTITGMKFQWRKVVGGIFTAWSTDVEGTGVAQTIEDGVKIAFAVTAGQNFVAGDVWTIACTSFKVDVATGKYIQDCIVKTLPVVNDQIVLLADTKVYINSDGTIKSGTTVPTGAVSLATIVCSSANGTVTVTDARAYAPAI